MPPGSACWVEENMKRKEKNQMKTGICSITFRQLSISKIVKLVKEAGLDAIEWGGDIHVPHGDLNAAREAKRITENAGLTTSSYGSYFKVLDENGNAEEFGPVLETAIELGTDTIRIWAGNKGSDTADATYRKKLAAQCRLIAQQAAEKNVRLAFEFHRNTMTDTNESAIQFLKEACHSNLYIYWQPMYWGPKMDYRLQGLNDLSKQILNLHVFHWSYDSEKQQQERRPLAEGVDDWQQYLAVELPAGDHFALMEFVRDNDPDQFITDAKTLISLVKNSRS
jgi:sugar phosphate isomerase/epimerase